MLSSYIFQNKCTILFDNIGRMHFLVLRKVLIPLVFTKALFNINDITSGYIFRNSLMFRKLLKRIWLRVCSVIRKKSSTDNDTTQRTNCIDTVKYGTIHQTRICQLKPNRLGLIITWLIRLEPLVTDGCNLYGIFT